MWQQIGFEMVRIAAGEFLYGEDRQPVSLPEYHMSRTPVTNAQYRAFVTAEDYPMPEHWKRGRIPPGKRDHPVAFVSWDDAQAFCRWAGCRLPTEQEWEKAASWDEERAEKHVYPWGDDWKDGLSNTKEAGVRDTTPVTRYPDGASPYGLLDMAGNVWQWCEDWYDSDRKYRALRGGSWNYDQSDARCTHRTWDDPKHFHHNGTGFRVVADAEGSEH